MSKICRGARDGRRAADAPLETNDNRRRRRMIHWRYKEIYSAATKPMIAALLLLATPANAGSIFSADSLLNVASIQVLNNTTAILVSANPATMYGVQVSNNSTNLAYLKIYNSASQACGSGTPQYRLMIPISTTIAVGNANGVSFGADITACITGAYADNDTTSPAASAYIVNVFYKRSNI